MALTRDGNVGIGTSSPSQILSVVGPDNTQNAIASFAANNLTQQVEIWYGGIKMGGTSSGADLNLAAKGNGNMLFSTNSTERMRITSGGSVCIGRTSAPSSAYKLAVQEAIMMAVSTNTNNMVNFFNQSDTYVASIVINASSVVYGTGSDYRLKEDLKDFNGLEKILAIKTYDFKFKKEGDRMEGVIAHELQEIIPYAVSGKKDEVDINGNPKIQNVDYSKIVPILIKSIQEQQQQIEELKSLINK